ncbi:MAG: ribosome-associated translation inhibitor RaiA [Acidobacteriota bacterium]
MTIEFTGRHTTITAKLKQQAEAGLARIDRVANRCVKAHVILTEDKYRHIAELSVTCRGDILVARCESTAMEVALHDALQRVEQQAIRHKQRYETVRSHPKPIAIPSL